MIRYIVVYLANQFMDSQSGKMMFAQNLETKKEIRISEKMGGKKLIDIILGEHYFCYGW